jgi:spore coat protein A
MLTRREFLKLTAIAGAGLAVPWKLLSSASPAQAFAQSDTLRKFVQPLRGVGGGGIPVAAADTVNPGWWQPGVTHYSIDIGQYTDQLHPDLPPTHLWGYGQNGNFKHLGGIIAAKRGDPVQITFRNNLPPDHILPVDNTIMGVMGNQNNRANVHLHGGLVPWVSDGGPHAWWDPNGNQGPSFMDNQALRPGQNVPKNEAEYYYPNNQGARLAWYHDHVFGLTRLNAYAGMASGYVIYDDYELQLVSKNHLPGPLDPRTVYMVFQEKVFVSKTTPIQDPTWPNVMPNAQPGDLWYAHIYDPDRWPIDPNHPAGLPPDPSCIPEFFGDTMLVNGTVYPYLEVEQREYRFRMLNATQARYLNPRLVYAQGKNFPKNCEANLSKPGPGFIQIGTEGGFIPFPTMVNGPRQLQLLLAPAERADLIVDFRNVPAGSTLILYADAPAPFPMGDPVNDYTGTPGYGPNSHTLLQIRVKERQGAADPSISLPPIFTPTDPFLLPQTPGSLAALKKNFYVRRLTLNEDSDEFGRLIQRVGTDQMVNGFFGRGYMDDTTEVVQHGATEIWEIINLTGDTHPMHFHLVNVQIVKREAWQYTVDPLLGTVPVVPFAPIPGTARPPDPNEMGWKETVRMNPGEVITVDMKFDLPKGKQPPDSPRLKASYGIKGAEYVWHCHILEHEEHDMMHALVVI